MCGILLLTLVMSLHASNILVTVGFPGSHLFLAHDFSHHLVQLGYNVTLLSATNETRFKIHPSITYLTPVVGGFPDLAEYYRQRDENLFTREILNVVSEEMLPKILIGTEEAWQYNQARLLKILAYFTSQEVRDLLDSVKFDLIVGEGAALLPILAGSYGRGIPVVGLNAVPDMKMPRVWQGYPWLMTSEPSFMTPLHSLPSFWDRVDLLRGLITTGYYMGVVLATKMRQQILNPLGVPGNEALLQTVQMYFVNDHPAISFAYLAPPNIAYIADLRDKGDKEAEEEELPEQLIRFMDNCAYRTVIYASFGTSVRNLTQFTWIDQYYQHINNLEACVILKTEPGVVHFHNERVLPVSWVPQRALLASGRLSFFLSHCGNNGRIEAILSLVPMLCIPLIGDQLNNAQLVKSKAFGVFLRKEDISFLNLKNAVHEMEETREVFVRNMDRARNIIRNEPGTGKKKIEFYVKYLIENGNLNYLKNNVISQQSTVEILNLDILAIFLFGFLIVASVVLFLIVLVIKVLIRFCRVKVKSE